MSPWGIRVQEAQDAHPLYQPGQPAAGGTVQASYVGQSLSGPATRGLPPPNPARLCEMAQILGRVGDDVVLTADVLVGIDDMMKRAAGRIPPEKMAEQREALVKEVTEGIREFAAHAHEPDPVKGMTPTRAMLLHQLVRQQIDVKLIYQDFRKTVPKEKLGDIEDNVSRIFEETQLKNLMKREKVVSPTDLESALQAKGSSLSRERKIFQEQFVAQQWAREQLKADKEEITHEDMRVYYQDHLKDFELQAKARWEELVVSFSRFPNRGQAYAALAALGNRVLAGASLSDVAKAGSDGLTARQGGQRDWTHKGSLSSETLDKALFTLPVNQLSPILECQDGYYIIRVLDRQELARKSFLDVQKEIKDKVQAEHFEKRYKEYVESLHGKFPIWTVFDASIQAQQKPEEDDRYSGR